MILLLIMSRQLDLNEDSGLTGVSQKSWPRHHYIDISMYGNGAWPDNAFVECFFGAALNT